ncbi:MAG: C1 family peptidase [Treponema sp.]|jgi:hypothetical protein|nr:C1 family peptidase [Treponema sp.]
MVSRTFKAVSVILLFCAVSVFGQIYPKGAILDPEIYEKVPAKPVLLTRDYAAVPETVSLKRFAPIPGNQNPYGTCVAWATAFGARTLAESAALGRTDSRINTANAFSPAFLWNSAAGDPTGRVGWVIPWALDFIVREGLVKRQPFEETMDFLARSPRLFESLRRYPISGYTRLFSSRLLPGFTEEKVAPVKKSLAEGKPVIIGMNTPESFYEVGASAIWQAKTGLWQDRFKVWRPAESPWNRYGGHAMCVIGYDDNKAGGAFEVLNSWGTNWGGGGFVWIPYEDFANYVNEAYELIENLANYRDAVNFGASIEIEVYQSTGGMPVRFNKAGYYETLSLYPSGTEFRFLMTNRHPAYVYAFSADSKTPGTERIFPRSGVSPVIDYAGSSIAWPGEFDWIRMDNVSGTDYLVILFAKQAIDIDAIERRFAVEKGSLPERVAKAAGPAFIPFGDVQYDGDEVNFEAVSNDPRAVFALLLAIDHQ